MSASITRRSAPVPPVPTYLEDGIELPMEHNPAPDSRCPGDWVISEAVAIRMLVRFYGWRVIEPGLIRRTRTVVALPAIPRLKYAATGEELQLIESGGSIADLAAAAVEAVA